MKPSFLFLLLFLSSMAFAREKKTVLYPNGRVQYEYEMDGHFFDGKFTSYYETGKLRMKGQFTRNQKTGLWRVWDEKGLLRSERNYTDNEKFTIVSECDSTGAKVRRDVNVKEGTGTTYLQDVLFMHRYLSVIDRSDNANGELFSENGLIYSLLQEVANGKLTIFSDDRFAVPIIKAEASYANNDVVSLLVKEEYKCSATSQIMSNRLLGICPVVMENGKKKELGWIYVPDIRINTEAVSKIKDHQYASTIIKSTVNDPSFKLRDVNIKENETLRLMIFEFEATAILYTIDQQVLASSN